MIPFLTILILLACVILAFFILVQNPKGGGLSGTFGSMSSAVMGVKQSADVMEKGTWVMIGAIGGLCIISVMFFSKPAGMDNSPNKATQKTTAPAKKGK
ncbi:MAG: secG [Flavipsychrobacter sp.]|jgi:preprotein translocase subunit SecG|nr:secG [Flavipsychrobacter sp.]